MHPRSQLYSILLPLIFAASSASALDIPPPGSGTAARAIIDSTFDTGHGGRSLDFNLTFAPFGLINESGFRVRLTASAAWYEFLVGEQGIERGRSLERDLLVGYGVNLPNLSIIGLVGPILVHGVDAGVETFRTATKSVVSFYASPTAQSMAYGSATFTTINHSYQLQAKVGWKIAGRFFLGPETQFSGNTGNTQKRFGAHMSGLDFGGLFISLSAGGLHDDQLGSGSYFSVNALKEF
jgi:hypothetical protein